MPSYFGLWKINLSIPPPANPADQVAQMKGFLDLIKAHIKAGIVKEAYGFIEGNAGYFLTGDLPDEQLTEAFAMWAPYVTFELHRTIPFPKFNELTLSAFEKRSGKR
jgi:hypothetical protein